MRCYLELYVVSYLGADYSVFRTRYSLSCFVFRPEAYGLFNFSFAGVFNQLQFR